MSPVAGPSGGPSGGPSVTSGGLGGSGGSDGSDGSDGRSLRVVTLNTASGRDGRGRTAGPEEHRAALGALAALDADVLALQEVDRDQPRSEHLDQARLAAEVCGATDWRFAPTLAGSPAPVGAAPAAAWTSAAGRLIGPDDAPAAAPGSGAAGSEPLYGIALLVRRPVVSWHVLPLAAGRARLPVRAADPRTGAPQWWWFADEPRVAVAAVLEGGVTVVAAHLSFSPPTAVRQLRRVRDWAARAPGPVRLLVGDLNLPGRAPGLVAGGEPLVRAATFPGVTPRLQLDHVLALQGPVTGRGRAVDLPLGDHRALVVDVDGIPS